MAISKADPPGEFVPASERPRSVPIEDYPYQVVAEIAARLLVGDEYAGAAKRAIALIGACRHELSERQRKAEIWNRAKGHARDMDERTLKINGKPYVMQWRELYEYITDEAREERAVPKLRRYLAYRYRKNEAVRLSVPLDESPPPTADQVAGWLEKLKSEGIYSGPALGHKDGFAAWKASGIKEPDAD